MISVDTIARVRRAHFVQGKSIKAIARELRLARNTVRSIVRAKDETERRYERREQPLPQLGAHVATLEEMLAAIVLALREADCISTIAGKTFPWTQFVTLLTPAGAEHEHHNAAEANGEVRDGDIALALIVQDGGLYYYGRTMGFAFA